MEFLILQIFYNQELCIYNFAENQLELLYLIQQIY